MAGGSKMATTTSGAAFKWLDLLEKEFDKSFVGLEQQLAKMACAEDLELVVSLEAYDMQRKLLSGMAQCFVQLAHKAQTIFQTNAKLEAELIHMRDEMSRAKAITSKCSAEKTYLICCLQATLVENHKLKEALQQGEDSSGKTTVADGPAEGDKDDLDKVCAAIQLRLANELATVRKSVDVDAKMLKHKVRALEEANEASRHIRAELESELVGARLDAKNLDKELAGRIQQIQILLASNASQDHKQQVWSQIEAEMHLQRSKTLSNMCYSKQRIKDAALASAGWHRRNRRAADTDSVCSDGESATATASSSGPNCGASPQQRSAATAADNSGSLDSVVEVEGGGRSSATLPRFKQVHLHKHDSDELGMAILGGKDHGLPIMISEIFPNSSVARSKKVCAGDVILAVNGDSFADLTHLEAVRYLSALRGAIHFDLENIIEADVNQVCDPHSRYYDFYEIDDRQNVDAKRSPAQALRLNELKVSPAKTNGGSSSDSLRAEELPLVHASPAKKPPAVASAATTS